MDSPTTWFALIALAITLAGAAICIWLYRRGRQSLMDMENARLMFQRQRPQLETQFFQAASASGKPRGLRWKECQWENLIEWLRDKKTGQLLALVGLTISFEAIEGGDMEGVAAVGNLRNASAVFMLNDGRWQTAGRAIFNLNPDEAVQHFAQDYERIG